MTLEDIGLNTRSVLSALVAGLPLALCYLTRAGLRRSKTMPPWTFPGLMVAGGAGGLAFSLYGYPWLAAALAWLYGPALPADPLFYQAVLAPLAEELGKGLILLPFLLSRWYRGPIDGLLYGLAAGAGFAAVENFAYFTMAYVVSGAPGWAEAVATRALPSTIIHAGATAAIGAGLGVWLVVRSPLVRWAAPALGLLAAVAIHGTWNGLMVLSSRTADIAVLQVALAWLPAVLGALLVALSKALKYEFETGDLPPAKA
jgi:RsiW-degrading membrane proteinase PrsW (M82 family)